MAEFTAEQVEDMVRTMELAPEQRSLGQITRLMDSVAGCKFFQNLPFKQQQLVCRYLRPRQLAAAQDLCQEGEPGHEFFVLLRGEVEIWQANDPLDPEAGQTCLARLHAGVTIGEVALIEDNPKKCLRSATVRCATACFFGVLARDEYTRFVKKEQEAQLQHVIDYYAHNPFLQDARADMILHMAHVSQVKRWGKGDVIMATGDPVDGVLFLKSGQVMISKDVYLAPDSSIRGSSAASLGTSGHPGLRQDLKKVTVDISLVVGYGDVVGEAELLKEALEEIEAKKKGSGSAAPPSREDTGLTRRCNVTAVTDVEAFHVKPKDAKRFMVRSTAAREALSRNQTRRDVIFEQRIGQWQSARAMQMQHGAAQEEDAPSAPAAAAPLAPGQGTMGAGGPRQILAPFPADSALAGSRSVSQGSSRLLAMGTMSNTAMGMSSTLRARSASPSMTLSHGATRQGAMPGDASTLRRAASSMGGMSSSTIMMRAKKQQHSGGSSGAGTSGSLGLLSSKRQRRPLWTPKFMPPAGELAEGARRPTVAFGRQALRFPLSRQEQQRLREQEACGGDMAPYLMWRASQKAKGASLSRGQGAGLDEWFEDVAYVGSDGQLCA